MPVFSAEVRDGTPDHYLPFRWPEPSRLELPIVLSAPAWAFSVADVNVHVDQRGHDGLARQVHADHALGRIDSPAKRRYMPALGDERAVLDHRAAVADD